MTWSSSKLASYKRGSNNISTEKISFIMSTAVTTCDFYWKYVGTVIAVGMKGCNTSKLKCSDIVY